MHKWCTSEIILLRTCAHYMFIAGRDDQQIQEGYGTDGTVGQDLAAHRSPTSAPKIMWGFSEVGHSGFSDGSLWRRMLGDQAETARGVVAELKI